MEVGDISAFQVSESLEQTTMRPLAPTAGSVQNVSSGYEPLFVAVNEDPTYTVQHANADNLLQSSMTASRQHLTQSNLLTAFPTTEAAGNQIMRTVSLSQTSTNIDQFAEPPQNSEGRMICNRVGCGSITFHRKSDWK